MQLSLRWIQWISVWTVEELVADHIFLRATFLSIERKLVRLELKSSLEQKPMNTYLSTMTAAAEPWVRLLQDESGFIFEATPAMHTLSTKCHTPSNGIAWVLTQRNMWHKAQYGQRHMQWMPCSERRQGIQPDGRVPKLNIT